MKDKPIRSPKHLAFVRSHACMIKEGGENCNQQAISHHLTIVNEGGMGKKVGDNHCVPLCFFHHHLLHYMGEKAFWKKFRFTLEEVKQYAMKLWNEFNNKE